jgi:hypothetical protein
MCSQGKTGVELDFTGLNADGAARGTFSFFSLPGYDNSQSGEYELTGRLNASNGELHMNPGAWIREPPGYAAVGFSATLSEGELQGTIRFPACTNCCSSIYAKKTSE